MKYNKIHWSIHLHTVCFRSSPKSVDTVCFEKSVPISPRLHYSDILQTSSTSKWASKPSNKNTRSLILRLLYFDHPVYYLLLAIASICFCPPFFFSVNLWPVPVGTRIFWFAQISFRSDKVWPSRVLRSLFASLAFDWPTVLLAEY